MRGFMPSRSTTVALATPLTAARSSAASLWRSSTETCTTAPLPTFCMMSRTPPA